MPESRSKILLPRTAHCKTVIDALARWEDRLHEPLSDAQIGFEAPEQYYRTSDSKPR